jgi:predicted DsbA family dithiol-disulfide isomerase
MANNKTQKNRRNKYYRNLSNKNKKQFIKNAAASESWKSWLGRSMRKMNPLISLSEWAHNKGKAGRLERNLLNRRISNNQNRSLKNAYPNQ